MPTPGSSLPNSTFVATEFVAIVYPERDTRHDATASSGKEPTASIVHGGGDGFSAPSSSMTLRSSLSSNPMQDGPNLAYRGKSPSDFRTPQQPHIQDADDRLMQRSKPGTYNDHDGMKFDNNLSGNNTLSDADQRKLKEAAREMHEAYVDFKKACNDAREATSALEAARLAGASPQELSRLEKALTEVNQRLEVTTNRLTAAFDAYHQLTEELKNPQSQALPPMTYAALEPSG